MASVFNWCEDNLAATGSPAVGTSRSQASNPPLDVGWKNVDDAHTATGGTLYSSSPVVAGNNSFQKYIYGQWTGSYNQILNVKWSARTSPAGPLATGISLHGNVTSTYATPSTTAMETYTDFTSSELAIGSGLSVNLGSDPSTASSSTLGSGGGFSEYLVTQILTTTGAAAGDMAAITMTIQWDES